MPGAVKQSKAYGRTRVIMRSWNCPRKIMDFTLVTQNVDGLHRMAGGLKPIELHGNINQVRCSECGQVADEWDDNGLEVPRCRICRGMLRPNVVWFGEPLPRRELEAAVKAAGACDTFFSIGTSAEVQPAASLAYEAQNHGAMVIEINTGPTLLSPRVDFYPEGEIGRDPAGAGQRCLAGQVEEPAVSFYF